MTPLKKKGPYIRKDGERNPDRYLNNRNDLGSMCTAVLALGMGGLLGDRRYAEHASEILSVWFVDPKTRMNPNLEFGQAVRGINTGRGTGIIDTVSMIHTAQGVLLLEQAGMLDAKVGNGVRRWFADYMTWMNTSQKGLDEKKSGNNHANLMPFVAHPEKWVKQQITKYTADGTIFPGLAGAGLESEELLAAYRALPRSKGPWEQFVELVVRVA